MRCVRMLASSLVLSMHSSTMVSRMNSKVMVWIVMADAHWNYMNDNTIIKISIQKKNNVNPNTIFYEQPSLSLLALLTRFSVIK